ncbi:molybdopterin-guanine dinucleotide biosynthesis protein B [Alicyclobacillus fastidiosus]|uniref:Molybdopterin-guanine dinucleotide biosynthesis protein B n=1 Tax=Alicyclobacillus fastidiosus TaxID=392011 RepID=A0ABY6ZFP0_9BACL|nr:molybdopterin-guanine dinucleotide biosynthesis protein B [Alicyclobacillus fastidiosus]WAH41656.1 molybdopterin-guanine dinucleotide biosynthesis protein B [Alicyclobacillus fastidiosus]GMA63332.1 hypothetical protein GCM10025859_37720 [Alicyclobacillus fastidiosus]
MTSPDVISVVGYQDAGKTQVVEALVRCMCASGLAVGVLKHDGHADSIAVPDWEKSGSDTARVAQAGARWTMVASRRGWLLHDWATAPSGVDEWLRTMLQTIEAEGAHVDFLIVEGAKRSRLPKIAVVAERDELRHLVDAGVTDVVAVCWTREDVDVDVVEIPQFHLSAIEELYTHLTKRVR